jgi:hypothetical protein
MSTQIMSPYSEEEHLDLLHACRLNLNASECSSSGEVRTMKLSWKSAQRRSLSSKTQTMKILMMSLTRIIILQIAEGHQMILKSSPGDVMAEMSKFIVKIFLRLTFNPHLLSLLSENHIRNILFKDNLFRMVQLTRHQCLTYPHILHQYPILPI